MYHGVLEQVKLVLLTEQAKKLESLIYSSGTKTVWA